MTIDLDDTTSLTIATLAAAQESGEVTARDIAQHHLDRIEGAGARLRAVVYSDREEALAAADQIDAARAAGQPLGRLAGIPVTIKDAFAVKGSAWSDGRAETLAIADSDAPAVSYLRGAGAVILGKTNVSPVLADHQSVNDIYGRTLNPWSDAVTPGGSSGGSASAVAAGLAVGDLGSDLAGSIRVPAAFCGVFGHRPTMGLVSKQGHLPWTPGSLLEPNQSTSGPLARTAADLRDLLLGMVGAGGSAARAWRVELPVASVTSLAGLRIGFWGADVTAPIDDDTATLLADTIRRLEQLGAVVADLQTPPSESALFDRLTAGEISHSFPAEGWPGALDAESVLPADRRALTQTVRQNHADLETQRQLGEQWDARFAHLDVVLAPAVFGAAPAHSDVSPDVRTETLNGQTYNARALVGGWSKLVNALRVPSTTIPLGLGAASGLPIGAQLIGPQYGDLTTIAVAEMLEAQGVTRRLTPPGW